MTKTATGTAITASAPSTEHGVGRGVLAAPAAWYDRPEADTYTRLTVTDDGQVYGHIAPWGAAHRASGVSSDKVRGDDFTEFHTGRVTTAEGDDLDIGHLTIGGGHAPLDCSPRAAVEHYDNVATAWAHVRASEGEHGIWVAGSVAPGVTDLMLHKAKAFPPSGDWRQFTRGGPYRMIACCQVVTPGFPVHELRAQIASADLGVMVASGSDWLGVTAAGDLPPLGGPPFRILVFPEGENSRDGRSIDAGATVWGDGPWTLWHKLRDEHGSMETEGTAMVGRIDRFERNGADEVWGYGTFDTTEEAVAAAQLVEKRMLQGVSADLGEMRGTYLGAEIEVWVEPEDSDGDPSTPETITIPDEPFDTAEPWMTVQYAELLGATLCGKPAFRQGQVFLDGPATATEDGADVTPIAASMAASAVARQRVLPFSVVGRPRTAPAPAVADQVAALQQQVAKQAAQIAALTAATAAPKAAAWREQITQTRRTRALAKIERFRAGAHLQASPRARARRTASADSHPAADGKDTPARAGVLAFNPDQARDEHGRFAGDGSSKSSSRTLSDAEVAAFRGGSAEQHLVTDETGTHFSPERQELHDRIIENMLGGQSAQDEPRYNLMGGGPASGKSTMMDSLTPETGPSAVVNADDVKAALPEYASRGADAAAFTHEESSYVAKQAVGEAFDRRINVTLDGTGDSSPESLMGKIDQAREAGYSVHGYYVTVPTGTAVERAQLRGERTGRFVPQEVIEGTHRSVSATLPKVMDHFDTVRVYDNTRTLTPILDKTAGAAPQVLDQGLWQAFLDKAGG